MATPETLNKMAAWLEAHHQDYSIHADHIVALEWIVDKDGFAHAVPVTLHTIAETKAFLGY
jgi:hypothetical protein